MKNFLAFVMCLGLSAVSFAQTINSKSGTQVSSDTQTQPLSRVFAMPQVQSTPAGTPTPQTSNWISAQGASGIMVEFMGNTFNGNLSIEVSNNPTPVSTPGVNYHTAVRDNYVYGNQGGATFNWAYLLQYPFKWFRFKSTPSTNNSGTLNIQYRILGGDGNNVNPLGAVHQMREGVPWKTSNVLYDIGTIQSGAITLYKDYKLPAEANGINLYNVADGVSGASTWTSTVMVKDPLSGALQSVGVESTGTVAAGTAVIRVGNGYAAPYPVATPPTGQDIFSYHLPQDIVIRNVFLGSGATTFSQSVVPVR